ncbi:MAG: cobalamin-dependent protein [Deltaproteobacteria bacterium]|nr:cobalamin-dependent protein [Deltaproteobacteria bacterium]
MEPELILVNPWIYDFAAYDMWAKPLGLLYIAGYLRECGFKIHMIDCLEVHHPGMKDISSTAPPVRRSYGTGKFWREKVAKPSPLKHVHRSYSRYGITRQLFINELKKIKNPSAILVTSLMTYWYPGVRDAITLAKQIHPDVPLILGGIYARLCPEHAKKFSGADRVVSEGSLNGLSSLQNIIGQAGILLPKKTPLTWELPYPAFDLLHRLEYVCITTSTGCPYNCKYCASRFLNPVLYRRKPDQIVDEIRYWHSDYGIRDFAFYDDALLVDSGRHMDIILNELIRLDMDLRFHTPNALHVREITPDMAKMLHVAGFRTIRLGFETSDIKQHYDLDGKVSEGEFENAVQNLRDAGFEKKEIGAYILMGLPQQSVASVKNSIKTVGKSGATPYLAEYSPLPHTPLWEKAIEHSSYDLVSEPLFHNNTLLPCWDEKKRDRVPDLKRMVREIRQMD